jgi:regulator of replication initiation timing
MKAVSIFVALLLMAGGTLLSCGKEVKGLAEEIRLLKEENSFLKAENIGLKKELEELYKKFDEKIGTEGRNTAQQKVDSGEALKPKAGVKPEGANKKRQ